MSVSLSAERDRIQRQVEELEQSLSVSELDLLSSDTDDESEDEDTEDEVGQSAEGLLAQREKIQQEIQKLENVLGPHSPISVSDDDNSSSSESELGLSPSVDSCLQMNLVYQQVVQETLDQLETLLTHNHRQQKDVVSQLSGPIKETSREQRPPSSCQQPVTMFLGRFLKPYFKDKLTGLGPPANQETKEKARWMTGCLDNKKLKVKRWVSWQKTLLIHAVSRDSLRRLIQPKLSKVDYLSQKLSLAEETDRQQLREQMDSLEREIDLIRGKKEEELIGDRYEEHDWQKISNIDFEATRDAEDIRSFWQNFLHPSINKTRWSQEEVQQLKEVSRRHGERHWEAIATELGTGRTAFLCLQTFQRFVSDSLRRCSWTPAEDALLRELVDKMRIGNFIPYTQMSYFMEGRDPAQLIYRWNQVLDPSLKKGLWTKQEDQLLLQAVSRHGEKNWWKIRLEVPGRSDNACRERYLDCLKADTKRGLFDQQEKDLLLQLVEKHGVGRWARIAAEIPHRSDAQCLREWRKLTKLAAPRAQKKKKATKPPKSQRGQKKKKVGPARKRIRRRLMKLKEEEEEEDEDEEEEGMVVEYMDSDEEDKKKKKKEVVEVEQVEEVEKEEEEQEYTFPPMQEWTPVEKAQSFNFLSFRPVELTSSGDTSNGKPVRSTILGHCGLSVIIGPHPRELQPERRHSSSAMMMVSPDQLRAHLYHQANKFNNLGSAPRGKAQTGKPNHPGRVTDMGLSYELQAAVTPWIGNLLIPEKTRRTAADELRERGENTQLSSTHVFLLLLQTMNVDSGGCKEMIEQRKNRVPLLTPPPNPSSVQTKTRRTIARTLQEREVKDELDLQHKLILKQQQQQQQQLRPQQLLLLQRPPPPPPHLPNHPGIVFQMRPNMHPQMSPMSIPRPIFLPHPVTPPHAASVQLMPSLPLTTPPPAPCRPPPGGVIISPLPAPLTPHRLNVPSVSVVSLPLNATSTLPTSFCPRAGPLTKNLIVAPSPSTLPGPHAATPNSSSPVPCPSQPRPALSPSSSIPNPLKERRRKVAGDQEALCISQNEVHLSGAGSGVGGASTGVDRSGLIADGRRIRKLSLKAKALQDASEVKAKTKKKAVSHAQKRAQTQNTNPPQTATQLLPQTPSSSMATTPQRPPPAGIASYPLTKTEASPPPRLGDPPVSVNSSPLAQKTTPASDGTVSSTQHLSLAPPPSILTDQHTASSTLCLPVPFHHDHDYTHKQPTPAHKQPKPKRCKSSSAPNKSPKAPPKGRKRGRGEEQQSVSRDDQCVGGTGTGVIQEGKRIRKPSQRARALQEATQAKAEAKKRISSSPRRKRSQTLSCKREVVIQNSPLTPLPGFRLAPGQSMWVLTPGGIVQLAEAPPQGLQLAMVPSAPLSAPPRNILTCPPAPPPLRLAASSPQSIALPPTAVSAPVNLNLKPKLIQPHSLPPPPTPKIFLPYKGPVRVDPAAPPPLRREKLQFDPTLMSLESRAAVRDWMSGRGGVVVPGVGVALPYLPPFVSNVSTLSALLRAQKALTKSSLRLLCRGSKPRCPQTKPKCQNSTERTSGRPLDLPDSTSDLRPATDTPAPSVSSNLLQEEENEAELVVAVRQLVVERFSDNPAYQLLKARFLSCFTLPALLATVQPITEKIVSRPANEDEKEDDEDEELELKKIKERGQQRRSKRYSLLSDESGVPANHFSGIINTPTTNQTGPAWTRTDQTGSDRTEPHQIVTTDLNPSEQC